jgi:hypothetical protein
MTPSRSADFSTHPVGASESSYCPECGQPLTLARVNPAPRSAVSWRSVFLVVVGLYFTSTFGVGAWHAELANQPANTCPGAGEASDCASIGMDLAQKLASSELSGGAALAARITDRDFGSDLRFTLVGLAGVVVGLVAFLLRLKRPRRFGLGVNLLLVVEGLLTVFFLQILLLGGYLFVVDPSSSTPFIIDRFSDSVFRALFKVFTLVGGQ